MIGNMSSVKGTFLQQTGGKGYFSSVTVKLDPHSPNPSIRFALSEEEVVSNPVYEDWSLGAESGASYALRIADRTDCAVTITQILCRIVDGNPTIVAAAAADAVWISLGFSPPDGIRENVMAITLRSWEIDDNKPHSFET